MTEVAFAKRSTWALAYPRTALAHDALFARRSSSSVAVVECGTAREATYAVLAAQAAGTASRLWALAPAGAEAVGLLANRSALA